MCICVLLMQLTIAGSVLCHAARGIMLWVQTRRLGNLWTCDGGDSD